MVFYIIHFGYLIHEISLWNTCSYKIVNNRSIDSSFIHVHDTRMPNANAKCQIFMQTLLPLQARLNRPILVHEK
jgi:hypothetical protein